MLARVNALRDATQTLTAEFSMSREEAQRAFGAQVLEGMVAHGYAREHAGRVAVTEVGRRMLGSPERG